MVEIFSYECALLVTSSLSEPHEIVDLVGH